MLYQIKEHTKIAKETVLLAAQALAISCISREKEVLADMMNKKPDIQRSKRRNIAPCS